MVVQSDLNRIKALLTEAVTVLCKNALSFGCELNVEGLLGITLDKQDVFLVSINETFRKNFGSTELPEGATAEVSQATSRDINDGKHSAVETQKTPNYKQPSPSLRIKREFDDQAIILDGDVPQDLSRAKRPREWSPSRKRHRSGSALYDNSCEPLSSSADTSMDPLDLIIKHERFSESDCENMKNDISRQFNLNRPSASSQTSSVASSQDDATRDIHIDKPSQEDNKSDSSVNSTGWLQETAPFCIPGNLLPLSNQTAFSSALGTQAVSQEIKCPECGKMYWAGQWLRFRRHLATHEQRFCELCGVRCKNAQALRAHRYRHNKKQRIQDSSSKQYSEDPDAGYSDVPTV